jgi:hypothetical protein
MSTNDPLQPLNPLARAVARWDNVGGAVVPSANEDADDRVVLSPIEQGILQCLGAAVLAQWSLLPTEVQKALFQDAVSSGDPRQSTDLREQIARFLHIHKDDAASSDT